MSLPCFIIMKKMEEFYNSNFHAATSFIYVECGDLNRFYGYPMIEVQDETYSG